MFLVGHTAVGVAVAATSGITNPIGALAVGWLSHYVVDFIPHGDESLGDWAHKKNQVRRFATLFVIDAALVLVASAYYIATAGFSWWAALAAIGATIPDVLWGIEMVANKKLFGWHERVHHANHNAPGLRIPLWLGVLLQTLATVALWHWVANL